MALFPQFPYSNLHELNLDWLIEQISQLMENGTVISVNGMSGVVTLYTDKDVVFPDRAFDPDWSVYRRIATKHAGLQFTGEKFYYITKNIDDEDFTIQEVYTSGNLPPFPVTSVNGQTGDVIIAIPVTSVNGRTGNVMLAGDNIPYNIDGAYTIEDIITPLEKSIGHVIRYNTCAEGVSAGQYVYLILSGISGRGDGLYRAVNAKSAGTVWTSADLAPVAGGLGALMANNDSAITQLNNTVTGITDNFSVPVGSTRRYNQYPTIGRIGWAGTSMRVFIAVPHTGLWEIKFSELYINTSATNFAPKDISSYCPNKTIVTDAKTNGIYEINFSSPPDGTTDHFVLCEFGSMDFKRLA